MAIAFIFPVTKTHKVSLKHTCSYGYIKYVKLQHQEFTVFKIYGSDQIYYVYNSLEDQSNVL